MPPTTPLTDAIGTGAGRLARSALRRLPEPVRGRLRFAYRMARPQSPPPTRSLPLPSDVADRAGVRAFLRDTDIFGKAEAERDGYVEDAIDRFRITMALVPQLPAGARVLELGSNPYFLTRLLRRRGVEVTCANWFGATSGVGDRGRHVVTAPSSGEETVIDFDHFNVETSRFPYDDGAFDLVLCCEILEHLPNDPINMLAEIHRVLRKPTGNLLLTTPNATRFDNLALMLSGENVYEHLSGYGTYGRHNREYTVAELQALLESCGYVDVEVMALDIHQRTRLHLWAGPAVDLAQREDNLFALARAAGDARWRYPSWLFSSKHALRRAVRPDLAIGWNEDLQASGLHDLETFDGRPGCWTGAASEVSVLLSPSFEGPGRLRIEGRAAPPAAGGPLTLEVAGDGIEGQWQIASDGRPFSLELGTPVSPGVCEIRLRTHPLWVPAAVGAGADERHLGVVLHRVVLDAG